MNDRLLAPTFLFRFAVPCRHLARPWPAREIELPRKYAMPSVGQLEDRPIFADVRVGWSKLGLGVSVRVIGKKQTPWCRNTRIEDSDGLSLWISTRDTRNIHRATRFCHRFVLLPQGGGRLGNKPIALLVPIDRAREQPWSVPPDRLAIRSEKRIDGYMLRAYIPTDALTGYQPEEHPQLAFAYAVVDRELGWQTLTVGSEFPFPSDPTLWGLLDLVREH